MNLNSDITVSANQFVFNLFRDKLSSEYVYHNYLHTTKVTESAQKIGKKSGLNESELELVTLAALFHDTGYIVSKEGHEVKSAEFAEEFLKTKNFPTEKIQKVKELILATTIPVSPKNLMEEVICDADLSHLGSKEYKENNELLKIELEKTTGEKISDVDWLNKNNDFFAKHKFYTLYAKSEFEETKTDNYLKIQKKLKKISEKLEDKKQKEEKELAGKLKEENKAKEKNSPGRGIETMFRNVMRTHVDFSAMADTKANIMISINTLILGGIITIMLRKLPKAPELIFPTFLLMAVALVCIIFAVMVTRPKITDGKFTKEDILNKKTNLLFFGNFFKMDLPDFAWGMKEMMEDKDYLYGSMIKDFYFLGQVLGRKYKYLRICYTIFMFGLIISVVAFTIAFFHNPVSLFSE
ncbi:MAG: HD domain-containing protein [Ignavibacteria bacterium]|nr:HD domain-containing protein [Ignavibacteria bacterium]